MRNIILFLLSILFSLHSFSQIKLLDEYELNAGDFSFLVDYHSFCSQSDSSNSRYTDEPEILKLITNSLVFITPAPVYRGY